MNTPVAHTWHYTVVERAFLYVESHLKKAMNSRSKRTNYSSVLKVTSTCCPSRSLAMQIVTFGKDHKIIMMRKMMIAMTMTITKIKASTIDDEKDCSPRFAACALA